MKEKKKVYKPPKPLITYKGISYTIQDVPKTKKDWFKKNIKKLGNNNEIQKWMGHLVVHNITHLNKMLALMKKGNSFDKAHKLAIK
jgi:hypothetical protein